MRLQTQRRRRGARKMATRTRIPVCGANLSSPVVDQANYIDEIHYRIGDRVYIENAN
jgi:hypothetical protein